MPLLERSKLYKDVWSRPCTRIAAELGISSSALKRICTEMDIPTPVAGYWTRVQCGKKVSKDPLPKAKKETRLTWDVDLDNSKRQKTERVRKQKEVQEVAEMVEIKTLPVITIAADLENLHPLVKATRTQLREEWSNKPWDQRKERKHFDARVFESSLDRALLFLDAYARGVESLGLKFRCDLDDAEPAKPRHEYGYYREQRPSPVCWVEASGVRVSFVLKEKRKTGDGHRSRGEEGACGAGHTRMCLRAFSNFPSMPAGVSSEPRHGRTARSNASKVASIRSSPPSRLRGSISNKSAFAGQRKSAAVRNLRTSAIGWMRSSGRRTRPLKSF